MKSLSLIFALVLGLTATTAAALSEQQCKVGSDIVYRTATMRDEGRTREESKMFLAFLGLEPENSRPFLNLVYDKGRNFSPEDLKTAFFNFCMSQET